jgi:hypothetical protein
MLEFYDGGDNGYVICDLASSKSLQPSFLHCLLNISVSFGDFIF